jgi:hypothetical protein
MASLYQTATRRRWVVEVDEQRALKAFNLKALAHIGWKRGQRRLVATTSRTTYGFERPTEARKCTSGEALDVFLAAERRERFSPFGENVFWL